MTTRKPPNGLAGAPYLVANGISVEGLNAPKRVFVGNAREAAAGFPANVNVAAALSLAGIGPDRTTIEIWADPTVDRNCHTIEVEADSARFSLTIENVPSENPKTGKITALSVLGGAAEAACPGSGGHLIRPAVLTPPNSVMNLQVFSQSGGSTIFALLCGYARGDRSGFHGRGPRGGGHPYQPFPAKTFEPGRAPLRLT